MQWRRICVAGYDAIRLFTAYAILEVSVDDEIVRSVSGIDPTIQRYLLSDKYINGLLREEEKGTRRIYHAILADYILGQLGEVEKKEYHSLAVEIYRKRLYREPKPDMLAAIRLAEHTLVAEGSRAFVYSVINECFPALLDLGLLDSATSLCVRALETVEKDSPDEATIRGNLGLVYRERGELDKAEEMLQMAIEIDEKLGREKGKASNYGNLGLIYQSRGELDKAEEMLQMALEIDEKLGREEGKASDYGNLGLIYQSKGELDKAKKILRMALEINHKLNRQGGTASNYGNLGVIYAIMGELDEAEKMLRSALDINLKLGRQGDVASNYQNLAGIYQARGDLDKAEEMLRKAVEIDEKLGLPEGMARGYGNLGVIYKQRKRSEEAKKCWLKALGLFEEMGMSQMVDKTRNLLSKV